MEGEAQETIDGNTIVDEDKAWDVVITYTYKSSSTLAV